MYDVVQTSTLLTDIGKFPTLFAHISYSKLVFHGDNTASA